jgi:hypothetical protein
MKLIYDRPAVALKPTSTAGTGRSTPQSSGGVSIPQTFAGSSNANPNSQSFPPFSTEMQFTTRASAQPRGSCSNRTIVPMSSGRLNRAAHPCRFTKITVHSSARVGEHSCTLKAAGISQLIRLPLRFACPIRRDSPCVHSRYVITQPAIR